MFLVGATGQLLTLILTVSLPFIFFISGHQNLQIEQSSLNFEAFDNSEDIVLTISDSFHVSDLFSIETQTEKIAFGYWIERKVPREQFCLKWKTFFLNTSGNKAPPASFNFSC